MYAPQKYLASKFTSLKYLKAELLLTQKILRVEIFEPKKKIPATYLPGLPGPPFRRLLPDFIP